MSNCRTGPDQIHHGEYNIQGVGERVGWRPFACDADSHFEFAGIRGRLVAAVSRAEVIFGWDLARWQPKPAQRAAPAGSVYWIEDLQATPAQLRRLADHGLWPESGYDARRRAEGLNRFEWGI